MKWEFMLSLRYLLERRKEKFISITAFISIMGIALGVATLIVTMGIMNGFDNEIEEKILKLNPHIIVISDVNIKDSGSVVSQIEDIPGVLKTAEFLDGQVFVNSEDKVIGAIIRGLYPESTERLIKIDNFLLTGSSDLKGRSVIVGNELANLFRLKVGDRISIVSPVSGAKKDFRINGIFNSGRYDYDLNFIFANIKEVRSLLGDNLAGRIGLQVTDAFGVDKIKRLIRQTLGIGYRVLSWKDIDRNLFSALKLEKTVMFIVVALIVFVACFNIVSTLIMTVMEKTKDIGILKAIGATRFGVMSVFLLEGLYISFIGIVMGTLGGLGLCYLQHKYKIVRLPADVYYINSVPIQIRGVDTVIIIVSAFLLGLLAAVYPSMHAGSLMPIETLRYE